ncbi:MAG: phosphate propanoyltransferase [Firmicutes bacterium]|uniref:Phosphate propanoyltransferase n=1 Tax=Candidatus Onthovivens merdipullorum TaxID=2840889 RepID=A0A9D9GX19_9BACL|nr:phosphate propanoyltransferase [Candidatus Onthovivens merdipullorum]
MKKILVETSARHIHVTKEALAELCGEDYKLQVKKMLSQPGQFASTTKLEIVGPKGTLSASILGPERSACQVEVSATEARTLGVKPPVRESGDIKGSAPITIRNPENGHEINLEEGCIIAKRHIHMTPEDAKEFGVNNGDIVGVKISGTGRDLVFYDTVIRVSPKYSLAMHIDTDECNAGNCFGEIYGELVK